MRDQSQTVQLPPLREILGIFMGIKYDSKSSTRARCQFPQCEKFARIRGRCHVHGGRSECRYPGCSKCAHKGGLCIRHGGGIRCSIPHCTKSVQANGKCHAHGGRRLSFSKR